MQFLLPLSLKGNIKQNKPLRLVMQGVGTRFEQFYDRPWQAEEVQHTSLVFIGRDLKSLDISVNQFITYFFLTPHFLS